jgi:hypothetical protein
MSNTATVDEFIAGIEAGSIADRVFCADVTLDATVPNWRYSVRGAVAVVEELGKWYADPGHYETLRRTALPDGELVEFALQWEEHGVLHKCHQAHILQLHNGRIAKDTVWCGGRWPAPLVAEMQSATSTEQ